MNKSDIKHTFAIFALFLIILSAVIGTAAADTSVAWTKDIGDVTTVDMSEDGSVIYAAVGSQVFVYDAAGVQQNTFTVGGTVVKIVCTVDGSKAVLYTGGNVVYYIDSGALTWSQSFTAITDIDISNVGNVLIVESTVFHKYLSDGSIEYDSSSGTFSIGAIDPDDEFAIVQSGNSNLQKYILSTTNRYWDKINNRTFNTAFQDYQNLLILYSNQTSPIILNNQTINENDWAEIYGSRIYGSYIAISDNTLSQNNPYKYFNSAGTNWSQIGNLPGNSQYGASWVKDGKLWFNPGGTSSVWWSEDGATWTQATAAAEWAKRYGASTWVMDGKLWIGGGINRMDGTPNQSPAPTCYNDIWWSEDGVTWTQATAEAGWAKRCGASTWVMNGKLWIGGGNGYMWYGGTAYNDVWWSEDGATWTQATAAAGWAGRRLASTWVMNGKLWIGGGLNAGTSSTTISPYRDVWWSVDGSRWTQATATAGWAARGYASSWVMDGKLWIGLGGTNTLINRATYYNDVWCSNDGASWARVVTSTGIIGTMGQNTWMKDNLLWVGGGIGWQGGSSVWATNVWRSTSEKYYIIQPSSTGETWVFYNYTGTNPQHTFTTYNNPNLFGGTYELRTKPTLSIYSLQTTKTLTGNIQSLSLSDRGDWLGTLTASKVYHDQITNGGFGTEYSDNLGSTGTAYDIATANGAAMSVAGQGQITDIYTMSTLRVGTYTAGGVITHVDIADKNALWAASGGEDGKVYVFSKDASSNWYLEYSSDSENPITALRMSARGEYVLAGRTNSLTLYQTNTPAVTQTDFWFTLYAYKDSDSYRNAAVNVSVYSGNQWNSFAQGLTDSAGKYVVQLTAGQTYKFDVGNGQKVVVVMASPSVQSQTVNIHTSPISEAISYEAKWNDEINGLEIKYSDNSGQTNSVTVKVQRTDTWGTVYEQTFTDTQNIDEQLPIVDDTTSYKVQFSANRVGGTSRNSFVLSSSRDIIPIPLDQNIKNVLFSCFLIVLAGLFSYMSAIRGALVVAFSATLFVYLGWLTIPWHWLIIAIVIAIVAGFTQRRG